MKDVQTPDSTPDLTAASVVFVPLDLLYVSDLNPRTEAEAEGLDLLAESLASIGLIQSLAGHRDADGRVGIVGGGRRLRAIRRALDRDPDAGRRHPELLDVPVRITDSRDVALAWGSVENVAREALEPADEIRAFAQLRDTGASVPDIARTFGTTEIHVQRRLALASLHPDVIAALKARDISLSGAAAFTVARDTELALAVLQQVRGRDVTAQRIRSMLLPDTIAGTDSRVRYVGIDAYEAEGGAISRDLFSDSVVLHDEALLDRLCSETMEREALARSEGWKWFNVTGQQNHWDVTQDMMRLYKEEGDLTEEQADRYDELAELANGDALDEAEQAELDALQAILEGDYTDAQRQTAGFVFWLSGGDLQQSGPWVRPEDAAEAVAAGVLTGHAAVRAAGIAASGEKPPAPRWSGSLVEDLRVLHLHAVQSALARNPDLLLDLLAFQLSAKAHGQVFDMAPVEARIVPERADGLTPDPVLTAARPEGHRMPDADRVEAFTAFRAKGKSHRAKALAVALARLVPHARSGLFAEVASLAGADLRAIWTPRKTDFFDRITSERLAELVTDLTGLPLSDVRIKAFRSQKKSAKAQGMEDLFTDSKVQDLWGLDADARKRIAAWLPDCL